MYRDRLWTGGELMAWRFYNSDGEQLTGAASGATIAVEEDDSSVVAASDTVNFTGPEVSVAAGAGSQADITIGESRALLKDEKSAGTGGGTFTSGSWQTRTLNTESYDPDSIVSISANQFTLQAGTYRIIARAPAHDVGRHQAKLRNVTDSTDDLTGSSVYADLGNVQNDSWIIGRITIASAKTFEIQHQCQATISGNGFGFAGNFGITETYTIVEIIKEAD